jgi:hypothetical protein
VLTASSDLVESKAEIHRIYRERSSGVEERVIQKELHHLFLKPLRGYAFYVANVSQFSVIRP